jgi:hypothetical protein
MQAIDIFRLKVSKLLFTPNLSMGTAVSLLRDVTLLGLLSFDVLFL